MASIQALLQSVLPKRPFQVLHLLSFPRKAPNIIGASSCLTIKSKHLVVLAEKKTPVFAIEAIVYIVIDPSAAPRKIIYVSKVDSSGLGGSDVSLTRVVEQVLRFLVSVPAKDYTDAFVDNGIQKKRVNLAGMEATKAIGHLRKYIESEKPKPEIIFSKTGSWGGNLKLSTEIYLFTRSEPQYLFSDSGKNPHKHILDDRSLLLWWLRVLDKLAADKTVFTSCEGNLSIPGEDPTEVKRTISKLSLNWSPEPMSEGLAMDHIPFFPDDPKARFLEHLVVEDRVEQVSVTQFWNELAVRQEFRMGRVVGIIHVKGEASNDDLLNEISDPSHTEKFSVILDEEGLKRVRLNNFGDDHIRVSNERFTILKDYLTGELYASEEGAKLAYENLQYVLSIGCGYNGRKAVEGYGFKEVVGTGEAKKVGLAQKLAQNGQIRTLLVKRKKK